MSDIPYIDVVVTDSGGVEIYEEDGSLMPFVTDFHVGGDQLFGFAKITVLRRMGVKPEEATDGSG